MNVTQRLDILSWVKKFLSCWMIFVSKYYLTLIYANMSGNFIPKKYTQAKIIKNEERFR